VALFVVDASVVCSWVLPDEDSPVADVSLTLLQRFGAIAPDLLWYEVRNVLAVSCRRRRIDLTHAKDGLEKLRRFPIMTVPVDDDAIVLELAEKHNLSAYDAVYLALALTRNLSLATLDRRLAAAAVHSGCQLIGGA
jgi:predicted nucleic acid-binding protein